MPLRMCIREEIMKVTRREFLRICGITAATIGLSSADLLNLEEVLANPTAPAVIWLVGSSCSGCSVSLLNRIASTAPETVDKVLTDSINLIYHPTVMALAGESAVDELMKVRNAGNFVLVVEGAVPTAFGGAPCWAWTYHGQDVTLLEAVTDLAPRAAAILSIGTCACYGGMAAAPPNPTRAKGVGEVCGKPVINIPGCPPHPDWIVGTIAHFILGHSIPLDSYGRPTQFFGMNLHDTCTRKDNNQSLNFGVDHECLLKLGCRGPVTFANCQTQLWNNGQNWCVDANAPCLGCVNPDFPTGKSFRTIFDS